MADRIDENSVIRQRYKVKVSICIAHLAYNASNALFVTNPSRQPHCHQVQPADTGWCSGQLGNPSQLYQDPTFRNPYK